MKWALGTDAAFNVIEQSVTGILLYQEEILFANDAFEKITGYTADEMRGKKVWEFFHPTHHETIRNNVSGRLAGSDTAGFHHDLRLITKKGKLKWVRSFAATIPYGDGFAGMLNMYEVTDQKLLERELNDVYKNMAKKVGEGVKMQRAQEHQLIQQSKMAAMGEMVAAIAHQWRQPLNLISMVVQEFSEMFDNKATTREDVQDTVYFCMNQIDYMSQTINDFQNYLKPSDAVTRFDVNETIRGAIKLLGDRHIQKNTQTVLELTTAAVEVEGNENEFKQVLLILLNNAMDAIAAKKIEGVITIRTQIGGETRITLEDNGGGIPAEVLPKIFDNYFTTKGESGTGLGLYMARNIIEEHMGGSIAVDNTKDGARFSLSFPGV
jgi:PAS domain S-box-containing protein